MQHYLTGGIARPHEYREVSPGFKLPTTNTHVNDECKEYSLSSATIRTLVLCTGNLALYNCRRKPVGIISCAQRTRKCATQLQYQLCVGPTSNDDEGEFLGTDRFV